MKKCNPQVKPTYIFGDSLSNNSISLLLAYKNVRPLLFILSWGEPVNKLPNHLKKD